MKKIITLLVTALLVNFTIAQNIDENLPQTGTVSSIGSTGSDFYGQSFFANSNTIIKYGLYLREKDTEGEVFIGIYGDDGTGNPDENNVIHQSALIDPTPTGQWYYVTGINIPVTIGTKYYVVIDGSLNNGTTGASYSGTSTSSTDTGENMKYSNDDGIS